ncbi:anthranilate phosphoribosyltransferase [Thioalkalivibrio sp. HK1]|uniref:anthranilate phosphoribosyltransferase n=1 Tax=Thioalkalivibrio sp. HK1 TaxID=1469245 RepID=UPI000470570C|nr:anthranilate phosphoribosyltransferase [Thioalkalivibrio sp. HK1]
MNIQSAIETVIHGQDLENAQMGEVMQAIMTGECTPAQIGGFLVGLRMKGETVEEIAAAARIMRSLATPVEVDRDRLVDTCGTGGDAGGTFNISTAGALVAAGAGVRVAKHGNRSISGRSGSADVLEAAGVRLDADPKRIARCIDEAGVGFLFAPAHHGAMKYAIGPRREMAVRTIFNVLGPLTNPAGATRQVIGVFSPDLVEPLARVLQTLGSEHVMVVHCENGLDEIGIGALTHIAELHAGVVRSYTLDAAQFGFPSIDARAITVDSPQASLDMIQGVLSGVAGPASDITSVNAGAAIYVGGGASNLSEGIECARESIRSGNAARALERLIAVSNAPDPSDR